MNHEPNSPTNPCALFLLLDCRVNNKHWKTDASPQAFASPCRPVRCGRGHSLESLDEARSQAHLLLNLAQDLPRRTPRARRTADLGNGLWN